VFEIQLIVICIHSKFLTYLNDKKKQQTKQRDSILMEEVFITGRCIACEEKDKRNDDKAWTGCINCSGWLHRNCISKEVESMSKAVTAQIWKLAFVCIICEKAHKLNLKVQFLMLMLRGKIISKVFSYHI